MTIYDQISSDLTAARKARDSFRVTILSTVKGNLQAAALMVEGEKVVPDEVAITSLKKHLKGLEEMQAIRPSSDTVLEIALLDKYLPNQMSKDDLMTLKKSSGAGTMKDWMAFLKENYAGQYDGKIASEVFKEWAIN